MQEFETNMSLQAATDGRCMSAPAKIDIGPIEVVFPPNRLKLPPLTEHLQFGLLVR